MNLTNYLAEIWGISLVAIPLALLLNRSYLKKILTAVEDDKTLFYWGSISFIIGITTMLAHNIWVVNWRVIVTILGWLSLIKGLSFLLLPIQTRNLFKKIENKEWIPYALIVAVFIGLITTYFAFTA